jgi:hypothetical protein
MKIDYYHIFEILVHKKGTTASLFAHSPKSEAPHNFEGILEGAISPESGDRGSGRKGKLKIRVRGFGLYSEL